MSDTPDIFGGDNSKTVAAEQLRSYVERIERLEQEKKDLADDIREVRAEAKINGFDVKTLNEMLKLRKLRKDEREERETFRTLYAEALGVFG